ncbi:MAG: hypothetical protein RDU14_02515 [Melioribacteraceae bacterium]|nr:hypothetical protein [Melioribacteraceae bacterium]
MSTLLIIGILLIVLSIGFIDVFLEIKNFTDKHSFAMEFLEKFQNYVMSRGENNQDYDWLTLRAERMQNQLGGAGIMNYKMAGSHTFIPNYPIILNLLPDTRNELRYNYRLKSNLEFSVNTVRDTLLRHIGFIKDTKKEYDKLIINPLFWFRNGVLLIVLFPIKILQSFGLLSNSSYAQAKTSKVLKFISSLISFLGFVSSVMSIALGWNEFLKFIQKIF